MSLLTTLMETYAYLSQKVAEVEQDKHTQALEILKLKKRVEKLEKKKRSKSSGFKRVVTMDVEPQGRINQEDVNVVSKGVSAAEPTVFGDEEVRPIYEREYKKVQTFFKPDKDVEEPKKKRVVEETLLPESFKKLKATEVSSSESTQEIPSNDPKEMSKEDVQNIVLKICSKDFTKNALWYIVKEKFSSAVPSEDKEKALWVKLKTLFKPDADDVLWKLQKYMHAPLTWKLYTDCGVHHVSSTRGHDIFMLTEKDHPLLNGVMILMLTEKLQVEEDNEMARDLVMKIFMEANKPKSTCLDTSSK
nr:hypothetical protein [Tanacetum cinerariifolium]